MAALKRQVSKQVDFTPANTGVAHGELASATSAEIKRLQVEVHRLIKENQQVKAEAKLGKAINAGNIGKIDEALASAKKVGVEDAKIKEGENAKEKITMAQAELDRAISTGTIEEIKQALKLAKEAGTENAKIKESETKLNELEQEKIAELNAHIEKLKDQITKLEASINDLRKENAEAIAKKDRAMERQSVQVEELLVIMREYSKSVFSATATCTISKQNPMPYIKNFKAWHEHNFGDEIKRWLNHMQQVTRKYVDWESSVKQNLETCSSEMQVQAEKLTREPDETDEDEELVRAKQEIKTLIGHTADLRKQLAALQASPRALHLPATIPSLKYKATRRQLPTMTDPRDPAQQVNIRGFYYPGKNEPWDDMCEAPFCGNFWIVEGGMRLKPPGPPEKQERFFTNTEAAFQCTKFWHHARAGEFSSATGHQAFTLKKQLQPLDSTYSWGPNGSNWQAMMGCLREKFKKGDLKEMLLNTGDDFLLEHNARPGLDGIWSDNWDGTGRNWLGLQCMVVRDELAGRDDWTSHIYERVTRNNGDIKTDVVRPWKHTVMTACESLKKKLAETSPSPSLEICAMQGCGKVTYNGGAKEYCYDHKDGPRCMRHNCNFAAFEGRPGGYCCKSHRPHG